MADMRSGGRALGVFAFLAFFVLFLTGLGPFDFDFHGGDMEGSWIVASTYAGLHHFAYGTQFVFTNGPLFPLYHREYAGDLTLWYVLARLAVVIYLAYGFAVLSATSRLAGWIVVILAFGLLWPTITVQANDATLLLVPLLTAVLVLSGRGGWRSLAVGLVLSAAVALGKVSFIPFCLGAFLLVDVALLSRRKPPIALLVYVATSFGLFVLAGQRWDSFVPFLVGSYQMAAGYSAALSIDNSSTELFAWLALCAFTLVVAIIAEIRAVRAGRERGIIAVLFILLIVGFLFIGAKAAFVRHDSHSIAGWGMWAYVLILLGLPGTLRNWRPVLSWVLFVAPALAEIAIAYLFGSNPYFIKYSNASPLVLTQQVTSAIALVSNPPAWLETQKARSDFWDAAVRVDQPLPPLPGRVDAISNVQHAILAAGLDYWPRPTLQENMTITPALIARNRAFFEAPGAPQSLIFSPGATDQRHPASVEGSLWPLFIADYAITGEAFGQLLLSRRDARLAVTLSEPQNLDSSFDADIPLPAGNAPLFLKLDIHETMLGKLADQALKPPLVHLVVTYADGRSETCRLIPGMIAEGMVISPTIRTIADYRALAKGQDLSGMDFPKSIRVVTAGDWAYDPKISASVQTMTVPPN